MAMFPRTMVGGVSMPRMIIGINWFLGYSHTSRARNQFMRDTVSNRKTIAGILDVSLLL
jgi:hypothetical protein